MNWFEKLIWKYKFDFIVLLCYTVKHAHMTSGQGFLFKHD